MARNASGQYSLPSNYNPVVEDTPITVDWANQTLSDIATEITNSLDRTGRGAMTGQLQINAGTVSAPGLTFDGDTNCGLYRSAADTLAISTGGTQRGAWSSLGLTIAASMQIQAGNGTVNLPPLSFTNDTDTGLYLSGAGDARFAVGGVDVAKFTTKLSISAATAATGGTRQDALSLTNGDLDLSAVTAPDSTTGISNRLTAMNTPKAWAVITLDNNTPFAATVDAGFNITSVTRTSATVLKVNFASNFSSVNYGAVAFYVASGGGGNAHLTVAGAGRAAGSCEFSAYLTTAGTVITLDGTNGSYFFLFFGAQ